MWLNVVLDRDVNEDDADGMHDDSDAQGLKV